MLLRGGEGGDDGRRKDVTVHGDSIFKAGLLLVPKYVSEQLVSEWHKITALHAGDKEFRQSIQAPFEVSKPNDGWKKFECPLHCV